MTSFLRALSRHLSSLKGRGAGHSTRTRAIALLLLLLVAGSARADLADGGTDAIDAAIAAVVAVPPLVVAIAVKPLRGVLQWLGAQAPAATDGA